MYKYFKQQEIFMKDPIVCFARFVKNKFSYLKDFENGNIYFPSLQYFIDLEKNANDCNIGDKAEGKIDIRLTAKDFSKSPLLDNKSLPLDSNLQIDLYPGLQEEECKRIGILSLIVIKLSDLKQIKSGVYKLKSNVLQDLYKMGLDDRILYLIRNQNGLLMQIHDLNYNANFVNYYGHISVNQIKEVYVHPIMFAFQKREQYKYQHEFRIAKNIDQSNYAYLPSIRKNLIKMDPKKLRDFEFHIK
ncbi:hypothetical protein IMAU30115_01393 [Lactobacillus helveticus]|nr:hypothetical protein [Lactobacillus helveticus]NRN86041.1 hypothetical protein [Lactobacillus helveticus]NRN87949.1 hypothetical protein [Lactobacillus helveticus]NRO00835.1 hypothetical protein [Lactobacillus helveticus]NRO24748.1 hypothetical protein [Lactobacillus helveticus]